VHYVAAVLNRGTPGAKNHLADYLERNRTTVGFKRRQSR
jgi:hypothetical protein